MSPLSRRSLLRDGGLLLGAAGATLAGCAGGGEVRTAASSPEARAADADVLDGLLGLERAALAAYVTAAPRSSGAAARLLARLEAHERQHVAYLRRAIARLGGRAVGTGPRYALPAVGGERALLGLAERIENEGLGAYLDALPKLADPGLRSTAGAILANRAGNLVVIRGLLGRAPAPDALPSGGL